MLGGLMPFTNQRTIIDLTDRTLYMIGPGNYDLLRLLPAGTEDFQLVQAPSGHLVLPCDHYEELQSQERHGSIQLDRQIALPVTSVRLANAYETEQTSRSRSPVRE